MSPPDIDGGSKTLGSTLPQAQNTLHNYTKFKKSPSEPLMAHQAVLPMRETPHPNNAAGDRWPKPGWRHGGIVEPQDGRRKAYDFGYRELRFKPISKAPKEVPELTLNEVRNFLVNKYGSLRKAFDVMDFFKDGQISALEWQEGVYNSLESSFGEESHKFRMAIVPRKQFNARMQHIFYVMDENRDGLINFDELSKPYLEPEESSYNFTRRRTVEKAAHVEEKTTLLHRSVLTDWTSHTVGAPPHHREQADPQNPQLLRDFGNHIMKKFEDLHAAFSSLDVGSNGQLNQDEFVEGVRKIQFEGDAEQVFKMLENKDTHTVGKRDLKQLRLLPVRALPTMTATQSAPSMPRDTYGMSRKDATMARKLRSPIQNPPYHQCGLTLKSSDLHIPLGQNMRSASGYYTFSRSATGRLDDLLHLNQVPGEDAENFSEEHGPGYCQKGPEYFPEIGMTDHPRRGEKWKFGATINREAKLGPLIPSTQGQADRDLAGMSYATYEGRRPTDAYKICNTGGISWSRSPVRPGITHKPGICMNQGTHVRMHR